MPEISAISGLIKRLAAAAGFDASGIAAVREYEELAGFAEWIAEGRAGEMRYLEARTETGELKRASLKHVAPWAKSVVVCAVNYYTQSTVNSTQSTAEAGWISRYAWSKEDYHDAVLRRLRQVEAALKQESDCQTWCYVDTGPLVERVYARAAGVGWQGKNTCIIHQQLGSWLFLGVMLTSLELAPDLPAADRCGTCTACLDACPTNAFVGPYELDPRRCISYLTIEKRGEIPEELSEGMGRHIFGCDICQDVCPWNRRAPSSSLPEFQPRERLVNPALEWLAEMSVEEFRQVFKGSPIKRAKLPGIRRNVAIAMGNSGESSFLPVLEKMAHDDDPAVAEHAKRAGAKLRSKQE